MPDLKKIAFSIQLADRDLRFWTLTFIWFIIGKLFGIIISEFHEWTPSSIYENTYGKSCPNYHELRDIAFPKPFYTNLPSKRTCWV